MIDKMKSEAYQRAYKQQMQYEKAKTSKWVWCVGIGKENEIIIGKIPEDQYRDLDQAIKLIKKKDNWEKSLRLEYLLAITDKLINHESLPEAPFPFYE